MKIIKYISAFFITISCALLIIGTIAYWDEFVANNGKGITISVLCTIVAAFIISINIIIEEFLQGR